MHSNENQVGLTLHPLTIVSESPRCPVLNVNEGPDSIVKHVPRKDGEPFDRSTVCQLWEEDCWLHGAQRYSRCI